MEIFRSPIILYKNNNTDFIPLVFEDILEGMYMIYNNGSIFSNSLNRFMKPFINRSGYKRICLMTMNGKRNFSIHRLVANSFLININPTVFTSVNHINGNKLYNDYRNLEWCSMRYNSYHASINNLYQHGETRYNSIYSDEFAEEICSMFANGISYETVRKFYQVNSANENTLGSFIYKLYHRRTRKHITSKFIY